MKAKVDDSIRTTVAVSSNRKNTRHPIIPAGTSGTIVESYEQPEEYAVDVALLDDAFVGGYAYDNITLSPEQFIVLDE